jgi:hypothetical protein
MALAADPTFDTIPASLDGLNPFIFLSDEYTRGAVALEPGRDGQGVSLQLMPNLAMQVARIGCFFTELPQVPSQVRGSVWVKKTVKDDNGMIGIAILDGEQTISYFVKAVHLPLNEFRQLRLGGNFSREGQIVGPLIVIQHAAISTNAGGILIDDIEIGQK